MQYALHRLKTRAGALSMSALLAGILLFSLLSALSLRPQTAHATSTPAQALLLIHGIGDTCYGAFDSYSQNDGTTSRTTTDAFLTQPGGWSTNVWQVGYYTYQNDASCNVNLQDYSQPANGGHCTSLSNGQDGTLDDHIRHLGCLFAWFIYTQFTSNGISVDILAHSMGGLITRDALGEAGHGDSNFPPGLLNVSNVVTVGTPHGGLYGAYWDYDDSIGSPYAGSQELLDMQAGSSFMNLMAGTQKPQGASGTHWALMAASNVCFGSSNSTISCSAEGAGNGGRNDPFPDGDGVVQASSALAMQADYKVLYGMVNKFNNGNLVYTSGANPQTQYGHEYGCFLPKGNACLVAPFFLNDGTPTSQTVKAWICTAACNSTDGSLSDLPVGSDATTSAYYSLGEMLFLLPPPPPPPTPTPTNTPVTTCAATNETDNVEPGSPYTDNRGNTWHVYYDIKRDSVTNKPCQMRVDVRIFNPPPNGVWSGTTAVFAGTINFYISASYGSASGSCTYQYHFVWRGPWFSVSSGSYWIEDTEYNGSNAYSRAYASFSI